MRDITSLTINIFTHINQYITYYFQGEEESVALGDNMENEALKLLDDIINTIYII